jgi:hypothetical protein
MRALEMLEHEGVRFISSQRQSETADGHVNRIAERRDALDNERCASCQPHRQQLRSIGSVGISNAGHTSHSPDRQLSQSHLRHTFLLARPPPERPGMAFVSEV